jgi:hypothetical protein
MVVPPGGPSETFSCNGRSTDFVFGFVVRADNICHLGGFITGAILGYIVERERVRRDQFTPFWSALAAACSLLTVAAFAWMIWAQGSAA